MSTKYNPLIYGCNHIERIVCLEPTDDGTELFIQHPDGYVTSKIIPNQYYLLTDRPIDPYFKALKGDLHYKWIKTYYNRRSFTTDRYRFKHEDTFSIWNPKESQMVRDGLTYFKNLKHNEVSTLAFDIETTSLNLDHTARVLIISNTFCKNGINERKIFTYDNYDNDGEMLKAWAEWVREKDPSIMVGHNILMYDLPYMNYVADRYGIKLLLGRNDSPIEFDGYESQFRKDAQNFYTYRKVHVYGREVIDTLFLAYKYDVGRKYENYQLKNIIRQEGLEAQGREFYDASKIRHNYQDPKEWEKIKAYAEFDADDALNLYNLMSPSFFYMAQSVARSYQHITESASGGQINTMMNRAYLQQGHSIPKVSQSQEFKGAISLGNAGIYNNVFKIDVASLYPNIILQYEVYDKDKDPNKYLLELVKTFTEERLKNKALAKKDKYYDDLQACQKIFINSTFGFMGSKHNNFNYPEGAAFITLTGRDILNATMDWAKAKGFKICNADTDSISFCYEDHSEISPEDRKTLLAEINSKFPDKIKFEDDGYYKRVIVVRAKNYILYDGKDVKYKGSALKATVKQPALKQFIKDLLNEMLEGQFDFVGIYNKYVKEIMGIQDIKRWATKKTITKKVLDSSRTNEKIVRDAIEGSEYVEGDKAYFYYKSNGKLELVENFDGDYDKDRLLAALYDTTGTFDTVIDQKTFLNYKLKRNKDSLEKLLTFKPE
jgi:DNA polymerase, archaea type